MFLQMRKEQIRAGEVAQSSEVQECEQYGLSVRSVVVALIVLGLFGSFNLWADLTGNVSPFSVSFYPVQDGLFVIAVLLVIGRLLRGFSFRPHELAVVYCVNAIGNIIMIRGSMISTGNIAGLVGLTLQKPGVYKPLFDQFPAWLVIKDIPAGMHFWLGNQDKVPWSVWMIPIVTWSVFWVVFFAVLLALTVLIRKQWVERERLQFPLVLPVVEVISIATLDESHIPIYRNRLFLLGSVYPLLVGVSRIMAVLVRGFPVIPTSIELGPYFTEQPWSNLAGWPGFTAFFTPFMIGIGCLISTQASFTIWFFYLLLNRFALVASHITLGNAAPWGWAGRSLGRGMILGVTVVLLWISKDTIKEIARKGLGLERSPYSDNGEIMSYRLAFWIIVLGLILISVFSIFILRIHPISYLFLMIATLLIVLGFARLRAETGYSQAFPPTEGFLEDLVVGFGRGYMGTTSAYSLVNFFNPIINGVNGAVLTIGLESYKMADEVKLRRKSMTIALILGIVVAVVLGYIVMIRVAYTYGGFNLNAYVSYHGMLSRAELPLDYHYPNQFFIPHAVGMVVGMVTMYCQAHYIWWPFLPMGIAISTASSARFVWMPFFIAWIVKVLTTRYGGYSLVKKLKPFAMGLILTDIGMGSLLIILRLITYLSGTVS